MFSRIRPLLKVHAFQNLVRGVRLPSNLENFLNEVRNSPPKQEYSLIFFDDEVQKLLKEISEIKLEEVFKPRPLGKVLKPPVYKLMTTEELEKEMEEISAKAETFLQMPPLLSLAEDKVDILDSDTSLDGHDEHHAKYVFIDVSFNKTNENRMIVVREPNGVLRTAKRSERFRVNQIFNPIPGREIETPEMFKFKYLKGLILRQKYLFILDRACAQFEPDEMSYHQVVSLTYEAINICSDFAMLYSTRHFGPLVFYLITHKRVENLLNSLIRTERIGDAFKLVKLYHLIHPDCKSAEKAKDRTDMENLETFVEYELEDKRTVVASLEWYKNLEQAKENTAEGIRDAHGV